ncbi:hypothetical protein B0T26DRAFT_675426 [Lasiosphaeria miniovina]|uniref:Uncharacterized protein n=1 Tax=Lasiosphaeria miniovina TaxID=1954250 RepID=A0AA40DXV6_9PEZI|nr:uncharacterized protein B0T26DRAFT_675426 [Lasiosphaeria miniovina]KAK0717051.1 hypothetical protein B0T26DRAFT_675426 [Lasiosphaeria miniovina]
MTSNQQTDLHVLTIASLERLATTGTDAMKKKYAGLLAYFKDPNRKMPAGEIAWTFTDERGVKVGDATQYIADFIKHNEGRQGEKEWPANWVQATDAQALLLWARVDVPAGQAPQAMHYIHVEIRIPVGLGGDPNRVVRVQCINDTGSNRQVVHDPDWNYLTAGLNIPIIPGLITTATGPVNMRGCNLEIRVVAQDPAAAGGWKHLHNWVAELGIIQPAGVPCLSGSAMRGQLFFATNKGNTSLFMADNKTTLMANMPA